MSDNLNRITPMTNPDERWQPIETAPRDGSNILVAYRAWRPDVERDVHVTIARWVWKSSDPERRPDEGAFLEINNDWDDEWGGNLMPFLWQTVPLPEAPHDR